MIPGMAPACFNQGGSAIDILRRLNLTSGLQLCLDAGDRESYNPSVQTDKWLDLSGDGFDFYRGSGTGSDAADPTFNGSAGGLSSGEFWSSDGGDYLSYDSANEAWMNSLHQVGVLMGAAFWVMPGTGGGNGLFGTSGVIGPTTQIGVSLAANTTNGQLGFRVGNGSGTAALTHVVNMGIVDSVWQYMALRFDEAAGSITYIRNSTEDTQTSITYASPSGGGASQAMQIAAVGAATQPLRNAGRLAVVAMWNGAAPTPAQLLAFYQATRGRFGM